MWQRDPDFPKLIFLGVPIDFHFFPPLEKNANTDWFWCGFQLSLRSNVTIWTNSNTYVVCLKRFSSIHFFLWVWQTWVPNELFYWRILPPWWWGSRSCGVYRAPERCCSFQRPGPQSSQFRTQCYFLVSSAAFASSVVEARCLEGSEGDMGSKGNPMFTTQELQELLKEFFISSGFCLTFLTVSVIMWVLGVLRDTLRTITLFITTMVVTDITNIRYLQLKATQIIIQQCSWSAQTLSKDLTWHSKWDRDVEDWSEILLMCHTFQWEALPSTSPEPSWR